MLAPEKNRGVPPKLAPTITTRRRRKWRDVRACEQERIKRYSNRRFGSEATKSPPRATQAPRV